MSNTTHIQVFSSKKLTAPITPAPTGTVRTVLFISAIDDVASSVFSNITDEVANAKNNGWDTFLGEGGQANTNAILNQTGHINSAALNCDNYTHAGYSDWMLGTTTEVLWMLQERNTVNSVSIANGGSSLSTDIYWSSRQDFSQGGIAHGTNGSSTFGADKRNIYKVRPQKTLIIPPTGDYNVGDYAFGGVVFKIFQLTY